MKWLMANRHLTLTDWNGADYGFLAAQEDIAVLQMANDDVTDDTLEFLGGMKRLRELDLNNSSITDRGLAKLASLPSLRTLRLRGTDISDAGIEPLLSASSELRQLDLRDTGVSQSLIDEWKLLGGDRRAFQ